MKAKVPNLNLTAIPATRKVRSDTDLQQWVVHDRDALIKSGTQWVRDMATQAEALALTAGNPAERITEIDGVRGRGFKPGQISQATNSARVVFVGLALSTIANRVKPILLNVISQTFPNPRSKQQRLQRMWGWYVYKNGLFDRAARPRYVGNRVPRSVGLYDVLILAPLAKMPAEYAWFANRLALRSYGFKYNSRLRRGATVATMATVKVRKLRKGFVAEAAGRARSASAMRSSRAVVLTQGMMIERGITSSASRARKHRTPVIRVAFKKSLAISIEA